LSVNIVVAFVLLLVIGVPAAGVASAQGNNSTIAADEIIDLVNNATDTVDNATDLADNATDIVTDSPFVNESSSDVVINEIELNPSGNDKGREWVELYNPADVDVNVSDFEIRTSFKSATIQLPSDAVIEANETYVVDLDRQFLSNTAESLDLVDGSDEVIDSTPSLVDRSDDGRTWQRIPDGGNEWQFDVGTRDELNDPDGQASTKFGTRTSSVVCHGTAGCAEGIVTRIVDGDTLYVRINATTYKIDLALAGAPSRAEQGYADSRSFTQSLCLGSNVLVDQDDKLLTSDTSVIAVVYCASTNLNSELLDSGLAALKTDQCETSEFANHRWAIDHGC
jgi:endonuclease YncB( thermonuclease family)